MEKAPPHRKERNRQGKKEELADKRQTKNKKIKKIKDKQTDGQIRVCI